MARRKLPEHEIEDVVQDTFLEALKSAPRFRGESTERVWLTAILKYKIADYYRRTYTRQGRAWHMAVRESDFPAWRDWEGTTDTSNHNSVTANLFAEELNGVLDIGLRTLCQREQEVLKMRIQGYCTEAICDTLEIKETNTWVVLSRARKKIKHFLEANWYEVA